MSKKRINSRQKGKRGEREWAKWLTANGFEARRGVQYQGGPDSPDVVCSALEDIHFEVKLVAGMDIGTGLLSQALSQASNEKPGGTIAVVAWRPPRKTWRVTWYGPHGRTVTAEASRELLIDLNEGRAT